MNENSAVLLRGYGISPSPQRLAVYNYLLENRTHPSAETIYHDLKKILPTISLTTVYNTLKLLAEKHALQEVIIEDRELRFDGDISKHAHFKCLKCGEVFDLFPEKGNDVASNIPPLPEGFILSQLHVCVKGYCKDCGNRE
ncbi:MAG: transcriptional repressor [Lentisphaeria bacterium]|nr:transcriptional repressor [Lentisphaeria bacterium]